MCEEDFLASGSERRGQFEPQKVGEHLSLPGAAGVYWSSGLGCRRRRRYGQHLHHTRQVSALLWPTRRRLYSCHGAFAFKLGLFLARVLAINPPPSFLPSSLKVKLSSLSLAIARRGLASCALLCVNTQRSSTSVDSDASKATTSKASSCIYV